MFKRLDSLVSEQLYCLVWCSNNSPEKRLTSNQTVSCGNSAFSNMSKAQREVFSLGCFTTCKKNQTCQLNVFKKKKRKRKTPHTSGFQTALKLLHFKTFSKKGEKKKEKKKIILRLISIVLRHCQKWSLKPTEINWSQNPPKHSKHVTLHDCMTKSSMHIKQFTETFQWDGQGLAPKAYVWMAGGRQR